MPTPILKTTRSILAALLLIPSMAAQTIHVVDSNVGIGTPSPGAKLEVNGSALFDSTATFAVGGQVLFHTAKDVGATGGIVAESGKGLYLGVNNSLSTGMFIDGAGRVGIGTTAPADKLTVNGDVRIYTEPDGQALKLLGRASDGFSQLTFYNNAGSAFTGLLQYHGDGTIAFVNTAALAERMRISAIGNVGIGASGPQEKLEVAGNILLNPADKYLKIFANTEGADSIVFARSDNTHQSSIATTAYGKTILFKVGGGEIVRFRNDGNVGIGTTNPTHKLTVNGQVKAKGFLADSSNWADFVFESDYHLAPLPEVEAHIREKGHLPGIPSAAEVREQGVDLMAMQVKLLQKVEELTLYLIDLKRENEQMRKEVNELKASR